MNALLCCVVALLQPAVFDRSFEDRFTGRTLRWDYVHAGTAKSELICHEGLRLEGPWAGSRTQLVDPTNMGKYLFELLDAQSGEVIYSRGYCSIYGEWETTGEAKSLARSFDESQRFPEPKAKVRLRQKKRADDGGWTTIHELEIDPQSRFVDRSALTPRGQAQVLFENGDAATKVDILVLGDGYTASESEKFSKDVHRLSGALFATDPFRTRKSDFNVRTILVPSAETGIMKPRQGVFRDTPLGTSFNAFDSDRYVLTYRNRELREIAAQAPYDTIMIVCNERKYGGGGIFNLWTTSTADTEPSAYVFVHEFGHSFAGLADEYYTSQVAYESFTKPGTEPWEPNITALLDPSKLKWRDLVDPTTPLPTPWNQSAYDEDDVARQKSRAAMIERGASDAEMEAAFRETKAHSTAFLQKEPHYGKIGAFEGGGYEAKGLYRPAVDCIMFTRNPTSFCKVCNRALERMIDLYSR